MSAKIMGTDYDDLAKLMGADLIVQGTAIVGEVKTGDTFYAGSTTLLTGSGTQTLNPANENVPGGYYATTTLSAVDADLAPGNIASGVTIFGFLGTFSPALVEDLVASTVCTINPDTGGSFQKKTYNVNQFDDTVLATTTPNFAAGSLAVGVAFVSASNNSGLKVRITMGGVVAAESSLGASLPNVMAVGTRALSGVQACICSIYCEAASSQFEFYHGNVIWEIPAGVGVGSVKT